MEKKSIILIGLLLGTLCLPACSFRQAPQSSDQTTEGVIEQQNPSASDISPDTQTETSETNEEEPKEPEVVQVTMDEFYGDTHCAVHLLGLQQYPSLESESYTDKPEDGKEFLVLFLQLENRMEKDDYFNVEALDVTLDGQTIENTFLVNDPQSYSSIFNTVPAGKTVEGFIVWQVPKSWKELKLEYHGWEGLSNIIVNATLTPNDIKNPPDIESL